MNNNFRTSLVFILGLTIGSLATYKIVKDKYAKIAQEEIDSVKETFKEREITKKSKNDEVRIKQAVVSKSENEYKKTVKESKPNIDETEDYREYMNKINENSYAPIDYSSISNKKEIKKEVLEPKTDDCISPYIISPEEFGAFGDYDMISLTYYSDKVLTDDRDDLIENIEFTIGEESLNHFGEYEDDSIFVRNESLRTDFEILMDNRLYSDIVWSHGSNR